MPLAAAVALRLLACCAATYVVWRWIGAVGLVVCAPLFGIALARPLQEMASHAVQATRRLGYRHLDGRHFAHRGWSLDIAEDEQAYRWISIDDVRKLVPGLPDDRVLKRLHPDDVELAPQADVPRIKAEALHAYLGKSTAADTLKFRLWLQREVIGPAAKRRQRR